MFDGGLCWELPWKKCLRGRGLGVWGEVCV